jgi:membrane protease YdiL (CAAX protease family)
VIFLVLGIILVFALLFALSRSERAFYGANLETISLLSTLAIYLALAAGLVVALRRLRAPFDYLGLHWPTLKDLGYTLVLLVPWYVGYVLVGAVSAVLLNGGRAIPGNSRLVFIQRPHGIGLLLLALLVTAVAAPLCEETLFRGMIFRLLWQRMPLSAAIVISGIAFGLAHASPAVSLALLPSLIYMGIVLALVYSATHRLTNSVLLHGFHNALATIAVYSLAIR